MSRFIKYASNLLDGVDSIAKDSLTDQGVSNLQGNHESNLHGD